MVGIFSPGQVIHHPSERHCTRDSDKLNFHASRDTKFMHYLGLHRFGPSIIHHVQARKRCSRFQSYNAPTRIYVLALDRSSRRYRCSSSASEKETTQVECVDRTLPPPQLEIYHQIPGIVYSQPADTGTGTNVNTQLLYAVNHLKVSQSACFSSYSQKKE